MQLKFGKYQGHDTSDVPKKYLLWMTRNMNLTGDLQDEIFKILKLPCPRTRDRAIHDIFNDRKDIW
jgi:uncharacterized protein (DUF3820 family)